MIFLTRAKFDNLAALPASLPGDLTPVPVPYDDLNFVNFDVASLLPPVSQLKPASPQNVAFSGGPQRLLQLNPAISVKYPSSKVKDFTLKSLYYACVLETAGNADVPSSCTVRAEAYNGGTKTGMVLLNYAPPTLAGSGGVTTQTSAGMSRYFLPAAFTQITSVNFTVVSPQPITAALNFVIDSVAFTTDETCCS